ncbi:hypothetical protein [Lacticaseibacillus sp. 53-4]|uniref:hypothetical protein n=1 Tax=Lacticaseibacillus sp. 53-4 TaxID=2799575 RepID=UPI00194409DC|nr:hypothetical protein [Lacticaseibacillus sp. 53-4]
MLWVILAIIVFSPFIVLATQLITLMLNLVMLPLSSDSCFGQGCGCIVAIVGIVFLLRLFAWIF